MSVRNEETDVEVTESKGIGMRYVYKIFLVSLSVYMAVNYSGWWLLLLLLL